MRCFVLFVAIFCVATSSAVETCPKLASKKPFDPVKFAGEWRTLAYIEHPTHTGPVKCGKVEVTQSKNAAGKTTLAHKYDYVENGKRNIAHKLSHALHPESPASLLSTWRMDSEPNWSNTYESSVVATDYDNYAIEMMCAYYYIEPLGKFVPSYYAQILGRRTTLPPETMTLLKGLLQNYEIAPSSILEVDNSNC